MTILEGTLSKEFSEKLLSTSFKLWIDTETGILLKLNAFNIDGVVINKIVVIDISFDYKNQLLTPQTTISMRLYNKNVLEKQRCLNYCQIVYTCYFKIISCCS
ncbi:sigma-E factor regulatory protein RseB domain-containing protein [Paenibacillus chitinolyticus]|uniref:sigma-E factor regulatory protein RseB domain-containing protein n=1 Tax=Paenibacillus chitinolyticus TaxID=79263 RepID=UPI0037CAE5F6